MCEQSDIPFCHSDPILSALQHQLSPAQARHVSLVRQQAAFQPKRMVDEFVIKHKSLYKPFHLQVKRLEMTCLLDVKSSLCVTAKCHLRVM